MKDSKDRLPAAIRCVVLAGVLVLSGPLASHAQTKPSSKPTKSARVGSGALFAAQSGGSAVKGTGTAGMIPKWLDDSSIGDSVMSESAGNIGIGTISPGSKLSVVGMIETTLGGYKFPDGTIQTTAATSGISSVVHNPTLTGNGTAASPLGVAIPLTLTGSSTSPILRVNQNGTGFGVEAISSLVGVVGSSTNGIGVRGFTQSGAGVSGASVSFSGVQGTSQSGIGVHGMSNSSNGILGESDSGPGVVGMSNSTSGVFGFSHTIGVQGSSDTGTGVSASSTSGVAIRGTSTTGNGIQGGSTDGIGVTGGSANADGVFGSSTNGVAVRGFGPNFSGVVGTSNTGRGVSGNSIDGDGVVGLSTNGKAGNFMGDVLVTGNLSKGGGSFKIDHPLDPENKYLYHSFVESPDMMNIYNGNVTTDENGDATVTLPDWFETLNKDFRYQLTVIGTFAQAIVANEVKGNRFSIKSNAPTVKVSWQVTGIRRDVWANKHRIPVEEEKSEQERGHYLHPELFNQPEEKSVEWALHPEMMLRMKQINEQIKQKPQPGNQ